jgi:gamma-glutamylcyclotransferase (GGCT)/AIG2-like uncharacterized protein YtfP
MDFKPPKKKDLMCSLFVYGTLQSGMCNHHVLAKTGARLVGSGFTFLDDYVMYYLKAENGYPIALKAEALERKGHIKGELWRLPKLKMTALDEFEGAIPNGPYIRRMVDVLFSYEGNKTRPDRKYYQTTAWFYLGHRPNWKALLDAPETMLRAPFYKTNQEQMPYYAFTQFLTKYPFVAVTAREKGN